MLQITRKHRQTWKKDLTRSLFTPRIQGVLTSGRKVTLFERQKVLFVLACFQASAAPRPENSDSAEKDALFALDTQITILFSHITEFM
jgi:hypothetical protein